ncbi:unnamed protein product [Cuscuta campestris]|uniref:DUF1985 domain-containing protein n=1 Tax=Cuscuta campestris TaxID=132261 RepID=A0A484LXA2_9ASTE|nr:unnamed protein product [Cuscuta campestris]
MVRSSNGTMYVRVCPEDLLVGSIGVKVNLYCNLAAGITSLKDNLNAKEQELFRTTAFGHFLEMGEIKWVSGQLLTLLVLNYVEPANKGGISNSIAFHISDRVLKMKPGGSKLPPVYMYLVDNLTRFNDFPWGFLFPLQIWAFETFMDLEGKGLCNRIEGSDRIWPRALRWETGSRARHVSLESAIFGGEKVNWKCMVPEKAELRRNDFRKYFKNVNRAEGVDGELCDANFGADCNKMKGKLHWGGERGDGNEIENRKEKKTKLKLPKKDARGEWNINNRE